MILSAFCDIKCKQKGSMKKMSADRFQQNTAPSLSFLPPFLYLFLSSSNSLFQSLIFCIYFYSTSRFVSFLLSLSCTLILFQDDRDSPFWEDIPYNFVCYPNDWCPRLFQFITWTEGKHLKLNGEYQSLEVDQLPSSTTADTVHRIRTL